MGLSCPDAFADICPGVIDDIEGVFWRVVVPAHFKTDPPILGSSSRIELETHVGNTVLAKLITIAKRLTGQDADTRSEVLGRDGLSPCQLLWDMFIGERFIRLPAVRHGGILKFEASLGVIGGGL